MRPSDQSGTVVEGTIIDSDNDLSAFVWLACDNKNLYAAFEITDDSIRLTANEYTHWNNDSPELFIGLYDKHRYTHTDLQRGDEPDYHFNFGASGISSVLNDSLFIEGNSPVNEDLSWKDVSRWSHTWIWNSVVSHAMNGADESLSYSLSQNYPNPFNPSTTIEYSILNVGVHSYAPVQLKVYDVLGREAAILVNENKLPGNYKVKFDARSLASGIYFYQLIAGNFVSTRKMIYLGKSN